MALCLKEMRVVYPSLVHVKESPTADVNTEMKSRIPDYMMQL